MERSLLKWEQENAMRSKIQLDVINELLLFKRKIEQREADKEVADSVVSTLSAP